MFWFVRAVEVVALMFGTDVLWLGWTSYQRWKLKQAASVLSAVRRKKKRLPRLVPARLEMFKRRRPASSAGKR